MLELHCAAQLILLFVNLQHPNILHLYHLLAKLGSTHMARLGFCKAKTEKTQIFISNTRIGRVSLMICNDMLCFVYCVYEKALSPFLRLHCAAQLAATAAGPTLPLVPVACPQSRGAWAQGEGWEYGGHIIYIYIYICV